MRTPLFLLMASLLFVLSGCGEPLEGNPIDNQAELGLQMGVLDGESFEELSTMDEVPIIFGFQGGTWLHLSIRVTGMAPDGMIRVKLGDVGQARYGIRLQRTDDGYLEAHDIPVPVPVLESDLVDLYDQPIELSAEFIAAGESVGQVLTVVTIESDDPRPRDEP